MSQGPSHDEPTAGDGGDATVMDDITGKQVPADETVVLHGYRVGPEGKQQLLERLQAGESPTGEPERPGFWRRVGCYLLDSLIIGAVTGCLAGALMAGFMGALMSSGQVAPGGGPGGTAATARPTVLAMQGGVQMLAQFVMLAYFAIQHASSGQTIGKRAGRLRVVNMDLTPISTGTAWLRGLYIFAPGLLAGLVLLMAPLGPITINTVFTIVNFGGGIYVLINFIIGLADTQSQRALHDRWSGTRVIWEQ